MRYVWGFIAVCVLVLGIGYGFYNAALGPRDANGSAKDVTIPTHERVRDIVTRLYTEGIIKSKNGFLLYVSVHGIGGNIQAGTYSLSPSMNGRDVAAVLSAGTVVSDEVNITIPEGWTAQQIGKYLENTAHLFTADAWMTAVEKGNAETLFASASPDSLADKPVTASFEGYLFPDTYRVFKTATPEDVIKKMLVNFDVKVGGEVLTAAKVKNKTIYSLVTMASILEREVRTEDDKKMAADVFWKRIDAGIPLQSNVTVLYALGRTTDTLSNADLETDSPYNTYKYPGLPKGPISNPGLGSITAALNPTPNDYYYFLTDSSGVVHYAKTLEEHSVNRQKYLK